MRSGSVINLDRYTLWFIQVRGRVIWRSERHGPSKNGFNDCA